MKALITTCLFISLFNIASAEDLVEVRSTTPPTDIEQVFAHLNGSTFLTGEYLYYKIYCLNATKNSYSRLSRIAYVELVSDDKERIFRHKIQLEKGVGYGDFFIPNEMGSGNYKLLAYTMRMINSGMENFFQADVSIINPYRGDQSAIVIEELEEGGMEATNTSEKTKRNGNKEYLNSNDFELLIENPRTGRRSEVGIKFRNKISYKGLGHYSLSVRKIDGLSRNSKPSSVEFINSRSQNRPLASSDVYKTEFNGSILSGKIIPIQSDLPLGEVDVALSIPGEDFYFSVATTNELGEFEFSIEMERQSDFAYLQVIGSGNGNYQIEQKQQEPLDYSSLAFSSFIIEVKDEGDILDRSIHNQIENAYFGLKPDTIKLDPLKKPFIFYEKKLRYDLDDYLSFSTMEEVLREIVKLVWTAKDESGKNMVRVYKNEFSEPTEDPALLFVDGVFIQNADELLLMDARKVKFVTVVRNAYRYGTTDYQGVVLVQTRKGDYRNVSTENIRSIELVKSGERKDYFQQRYDDKFKDEWSRIPDFRHQLFWKPDIVLSGNETDVSFFTSDISGEYEIRLEGFTNLGQPVSLMEIISVE